MKLSEMNVTDIYVGMKLKSATGKNAQIAKYPENFKHPNDIIVNDCVNITDDGWLFINIDGDDWDGHGVYHSQADLITVDN